MRGVDVAEVPTSCCTFQFFRSTMDSALPPSVTEAARWVPSRLTEDDMILPLLMTRRSPYGAMYWSLEMTWPWSVTWPTWSVPNWWVWAKAVPAARRATAVVPAVSRGVRRPRRLPRKPEAFSSTRLRRRLTCMGLSLRSGGQQVDVAVELPQRVRCVPGRGPH